MEQLEIQGLEKALGIYHPWTIKSVTADEEKKHFDVHLGLADKKRLFGLFGGRNKNQDETLFKGSWTFVNVGNYRCVVHAEVPIPGTEGANAINAELIAQAAFLGNPARAYSNQLRQQIALAKLKGVDIALMAELLHLDHTIISEIIEDIAVSTAHSKTLSYLPTENDPVWVNVLQDQQLLKTNVLPLKLLLSKLKLAVSKSASADELLGYVIELRKFFISNAASLDNEIDQLCGLDSEKIQRKVQAQKSKQKLVLPSIKNPIWLDVLSGKLRLNSHSVPLNLLISRQRVAFIQANATQNKVQAIEVLRSYFRKNHRSLKPELVLLNRAMAIREKAQVRLPDPEHQVWQKILTDESFMQSDHMAYKLLLAKLRTQITTEKNPVVRMEAARRIRDFMRQNQKSMRKELSVLLKQTQAG